MKYYEKKYIIDENNFFNYYEIKNDKPVLILLHAQGTNSLSFEKCFKPLSKKYHLYLIDCYGHGKSSKVHEKYNLKSIGDDMLKFINSEINSEFSILGHSSGGLIAAYIAAHSNKCNYLILEDAPLFSSCGNERLNTFNYLDLSTVCNNFIKQKEEKDFITYYFINQYCWNFFPDDSREKIKSKLSLYAKRYRIKHPDKRLKVPFWPSKFLEVFKGMNDYDPYFGLSFYNDQFNEDIDYESLLSNIKCKTLFMKANTIISKEGVIQGALTDEHLNKVKKLIKNIEIVYFDCGHGIHAEKRKQFLNCLNKL